MNTTNPAAMTNRLSYLAKADVKGKYVLWILRGTFPNQCNVGVMPTEYNTLQAANDAAKSLNRIANASQGI